MRKWILLNVVVLMFSCNENPSVKELLFKGNSAYGQSDFLRAIDFYAQAFRLDSTESITHYNKGNALYKSKQWQEAMKSYEYYDTRQVFSDMAALNHNKGNILFETAQFEKALTFYKAALRLDPQDIEAQYNYQLTLAQWKRQSDKKKNDPSTEKEQEKNDSKKQGGEEAQGGKADEKEPKTSDLTKKEESQESPSPNELPRQPKTEREKDNQEKPSQEGQSSDKRDEATSETEGLSNSDDKMKLSKVEAQRILRNLEKKEEQLQQMILKKESQMIPVISEKEW